MRASDPNKKSHKPKAKTLVVLDQNQKIKEIKQQLSNFEGVPLESIKPIVLDEIIPKEDETNWIGQIPLVPSKQKNQDNKSQKNNNVESIDKQQKKILDTNQIFFVNFEKIEQEQSQIQEQPKEVERLLEYKIEIMQKLDESFKFQPIEKIDYLILPPSNTQMPLQTNIDLKEISIFQPQPQPIQKFELKFEPIEKIQIWPITVYPNQTIIPLNEIKEYTPQLKFEQINTPWLEFKKEEKIPKMHELSLEEKIYLTPFFYFETFQRITKPQITIKLFEKNPSLNNVEIKTLAQIEEKETTTKEVSPHSTIFGIEEIEKYLEVGKSIEPDIKKHLQKQSQIKISAKTQIEVGKKELEEYVQFFLLQNNIIDFLEDNPQYYYEKLPNWAKELFEVVKIEQQYWELVRKKLDNDYENQKENFIKKLDLLNIEQRILLEKMIKSSKALAALIVILEENKNERTIEQVEKIYKKIIQDYPDIKLLTEYRFAKYLFIKTFEKEEIGPDPNIKILLGNFDKNIKSFFYCFWIILLDEIIKNSNNKKLVSIAAEKYSQIIVKNPTITKELEIIKKVETAIREFFFEEKILQINEAEIKEVIFYEIAYLLYQMYKRREQNG